MFLSTMKVFVIQLSFYILMAFMSKTCICNIGIDSGDASALPSQIRFGLARKSMLSSNATKNLSLAFLNASHYSIIKVSHFQNSGGHRH
jgi:hypothetical protein